MLQISEPVDVWVFFKGGAVKPWCFFWRGRKIKVDKINLIHTSKNGSNIFYHFSLSAAGNFYRIRFDVSKLKWILEGVEEEN